VAVSTSDLQLIATITVLSCDEGHLRGTFPVVSALVQYAKTCLSLGRSGIEP